MMIWAIRNITTWQNYTILHCEVLPFLSQVSKANKHSEWNSRNFVRSPDTLQVHQNPDKTWVFLRLLGRPVVYIEPRFMVYCSVENNPKINTFRLIGHGWVVPWVIWLQVKGWLPVWTSSNLTPPPYGGTIHYLLSFAQKCSIPSVWTWEPSLIGAQAQGLWLVGLVVCYDLT